MWYNHNDIRKLIEIPDPMPFFYPVLSNRRYLDSTDRKFDETGQLCRIPISGTQKVPPIESVG